MYSEWLLFFISVAYLAVLFGVAYGTEYFSKTKPKLTNNSLIYTLSLGVYCTAWTFYGSVGQAAQSGLDFLTTYIGVLLTAPLWWLVLRKIIRISRAKGLTTLADFISARYGKSIALGRLITVLCVLGIVPYISIQIKAIAMSVRVLTSSAFGSVKTDFWQGNLWVSDTAFYATILVGFFTMLFTTRNLQSDNKNRGMMAAIALESVVKLGVFLFVGLFVVYGMFDGLTDVFEKAAQQESLRELSVIQHQKSQTDWFWHLLLSALAFFLLPRQFQVSVVENESETHLLSAMWIFPTYLLLINFLVLPIALAGRLWFNEQVDADTYMLVLPLSSKYPFIAILAFVGGFSAATSMIIVSTAALSSMITNNLLLPDWVNTVDWKNPNLKALTSVKWFRRAGILLILFLSYLYFRTLGEYDSLVSIGVVSFAAIAQLAPAFFGGIFWKRGNKQGAFISISIGFLIWAYTLILPTLAQNGFITPFWQAPHFPTILNPHTFLGLKTLDAVSQSLFWSLFFNSFSYVLVSLLTTQDVKERNEAEIMVDIFAYQNNYESAVVWKGKAYFSELEMLLISFLGKKQTQKVLKLYAQTEKDFIDFTPNQLVGSRLLTFSERMLSSVVGTTSARILILSLLHEQESVAMEDVLHILEESQTLISSNRKLREQSLTLKKITQQLTLSNQKLKEQDRIKNDFISTVTHELRTPLTSIRALSEIVHHNPDLDEDERAHFLENIVSECERLTSLIDEILDIEHFDSGKMKVEYQEFDIQKMMVKIQHNMSPLANAEKIQLYVSTASFSVYADEKRIEQALINLVANAIKHMKDKQYPNYNYQIELRAIQNEHTWQVEVKDNGRGIALAHQESIFEKFHQIRDAHERKPKGSGLGLSITKRIVEIHQGKIELESNSGKGTLFRLIFPK